MNQAPQMPPPPEPSAEEMAKAMTRTNRTPLYIALGVIAACLAYGGLYVLRGASAVRSDLEGRGYTDVTVKVEGPFSFSFTGKKGGATCSGAMERLPFSSTVNESCFEIALDGPQTPAPKPTTHADLERTLTENYADYGFDKFECGEIGAGDKVLCTMNTPGGTSVNTEMTVTRRKPDGSWAEWNIHPVKDFARATKIAQSLQGEATEAMKKKGRTIDLDVDCGKGPVFFDAPLQCTAKTKEKPPREGKLAVTFKDDGASYDWKLTGL